MKKIILFASILLLITGLAASAVALPTGTWDYQVTENSSTWLSLYFTDLAGSLNYELWLETTPTTSGAWDVYYNHYWEGPGGSITFLGQIAFNQSDASWRTMNLNNAVLSGDGYLRVSLQDLGTDTNPVAYLRDFTNPAAPVPEPATMLLLGSGLLGLAGFRKRFKK